MDTVITNSGQSKLLNNWKLLKSFLCLLLRQQKRRKEKRKNILFKQFVTTPEAVVLAIFLYITMFKGLQMKLQTKLMFLLSVVGNIQNYVLLVFMFHTAVDKCRTRLPTNNRRVTFNLNDKFFMQNN